MDELIKVLRETDFSDGCPCGAEPMCKGNDCIIIQAADAIEELVRKEKFHAFLWNTIQPNEMEAYISMYNAGNEKEES